MSYQKEATTNRWNLRTGEAADEARKNRQPDSTTERWTITVNEREWTLTATRYQERDGSRSRAFWRIDETGANRRDHDGDVNLTQDWRDDDDKAPTVGVNWPCRGTQPVKEVARFVSDLSAATQAAMEAQEIIDQEA